MDPTPNNLKPLATLSPADARVLDQLIEAGIPKPGVNQPGAPNDSTAANSAAFTPSDSARAKVLTAILALVGRCPAQTPPLDLDQRTLAKVRRFQFQERDALRQQASPPWAINIRWAELGTIAAVLVIGVTVLIPVLGRMRDDARTVACSNNLGEAGAALAAYAGDNDLTAPRRGSWPGTVWWNVGKEARVAPANAPIESNAAHLYQLVRDGYVDPNVLNCPGNEHAIRDLSPQLNDYPSAQAASYSYQNQFTRYTTPIDRSPGMALLADKNPLFVVDKTKPYGLVYNPHLDPNSASPFHQGRGQNILIADGHAYWSTTPVLPNGDNIWLANGVDKYNGTEPPSAPDDSFLVP